MYDQFFKIFIQKKHKLYQLSYLNIRLINQILITYFYPQILQILVALN